MVGQLYWRATPAAWCGREVLRRNLLGPRLRDVPVLAELAVHVAAGGGNRESGCAGQVVEERLLLDGIDVRRAHARMHERVVDAAAILAHAAVAALLVAHHALARAQFALDLAVLQLLVELRLEGELRVALCLPARCRGDGRGGRGQFSRSQRRSRGQRALQKRAAVERNPRHVFR